LKKKGARGSDDDDRDRERGQDASAQSGAASGHVPVLLAEILDYLRPRSNGTYVDATLGGGGVAEALLRANAPAGRLVALDRDRDAVALAEKRLAAFASRLSLVWGSFAELPLHLDRLGIERVDGIVADLGLSSIQLGDPARGFTFLQEGPLDMRFDLSQGPTAAELVNQMQERELARILREYGEERRASAIARRIVERRPIRTTAELRRAVVSVLGPRRRGIDPATRTFQALRIAVNRELEALGRFLEVAPERLGAEGRLVVVSYHSLEDRAVKLAFRSRARTEGEAPGGSRYRVLTKKPVVASEGEIDRNRRARSAKLRALERVA
jgi:16S rRNA (cytosine1402-N4)-methyltransferase